MIKSKPLLITILLLACSMLSANPLDEMFASYQQAGVTNPDKKSGEILWNKTFTSEKFAGQRSCTSCHGGSVTDTGKHARTGKLIQPMALSINKNRYSDVKKVNKWFKRNCKWTLGRECNAQEQADILSYLISK